MEQVAKRNDFLTKPALNRAINLLGHEIKNGILKPGQKLPSTRELSKKYHVSLVTMHKTLAELSQRGMIESYPRQGSFVADKLAKFHTVKRIGVVTGRKREALFMDPYFGQVVKGLCQSLEKKIDYDLTLLTYDIDLNQYFQNDLLDALVEVSPRQEKLEFRNYNDLFGRMPHVFIQMDPLLAKKHKLISVSSKNYDATFQIIENLYNAGNRTFLCVFPGNIQHYHYGSLSVYKGCLDALNKYGINVEKSVKHIPSEESGLKEILDKFVFNSAQCPDALFFSNLRILNTVSNLLKEARISIPNDIRLAAFGSQREEQNQFGKEFPIAMEPTEEMGGIAGDLLLKQFEGKNLKTKNVLVECELIDNHITQEIKNEHENK